MKGMILSYEKGYAAALLRLRASNPYAAGSYEERMWYAGWDYHTKQCLGYCQ